MKAIVFHEHGGVDKLGYEDVETPKPGASEILVRVKAAGVNHFDHDIREGVSGIEHQLPHILGLEGAGEVAEVAPDVTAVKVGDRVSIMLNRPCGHCRYCRSGLDQLCQNAGYTGVTTWGTYAEFVKTGETHVVPLPDAVDFEDAAAAFICFGTVWNMVISLGKLQPGETVLVNAAGSGIGSSAIQLCKLNGARVIASASTDEKLEKAKALGADEVINYATHNLADEARRLTGGDGVDLVIESVGGDILTQSIHAVRSAGRVVTCGAHAGERVEIDIIELFRRQISLIGNDLASRVQFETVLALVAEGKLKPAIHATFPLSETREAAKIAAERGVFGKLVLIP